MPKLCVNHGICLPCGCHVTQDDDDDSDDSGDSGDEDGEPKMKQQSPRMFLSFESEST